MNEGSEIRYGVYMGNFGAETAWYLNCDFPGTIYFGLDVIDAEDVSVAQTSHGRIVWSCAKNFLVSIKPGAIDQLLFGTISDSWSLQAGPYTLRERAETSDVAFGDEGAWRRGSISLGRLQAERGFTVN
jgi:hypothetical protein